MVTNLSSFPSALTVVPVPDGNVRKHRQDFIVNEDLKRMGCSGRSALSLSPPADASQTKFHQLFRTSDRIPFFTTVIEVVRLCQIALTLFERLKPEYADGLLCDITERGINDWWTQFGTEFYNDEPNDGVLGPMTVAALLGMVLGARNRLSSCGAPAPKDAFDIPQLKKAIYHFQRQQRIPRTRRLDRQTMDRLQKATMKNGAGTSGDIFAVPRAIKSTVVDLGGRAVGSTSNKVESSAMETTDIEKFVQHLSGDTCKFLWQGKQPKKSTAAVGSIQSPPTVSRSRRNSIGGGSISEDEQLGRDTPNPGSPVMNHHPSNASLGSSALGASGCSADTKDATGVSDLRKAVFKTMTGRMKDVASGISAGADYVRGRGHHQRSALTKEFHSGEGSEFHDSLEHGTATPTNGGLRLLTGSQMAQLERDAHATGSPTTSILKMSFHTESPIDSNSGHFLPAETGLMTGYNSLTGSVHRDQEGHGHASDYEDQEFVDAQPGSSHGSSTTAPRPRHFQRTKSFSKLIEAAWEAPRHEEYWPRRLSFSLAEEAVLTWDELTALSASSDIDLPNYKIMKQLAEDTPTLTEWTNRKLTTVENLHQYLATSYDELQRVRNEQGEIVQYMRDSKWDVLQRQTQGLKDAVREVEAMGARMQYELGNVRGKMSDVEDAVRGFERSVEEVEELVGVEQVESGGRGGGWWGWLW